MEILCCSAALLAKWCPTELQHFTSENGSARNFHYNIKNYKFILSSPPPPPPLYSIYNYIPQTSHVASANNVTAIM